MAKEFHLPAALAKHAEKMIADTGASGDELERYYSHTRNEDEDIPSVQLRYASEKDKHAVKM